MTTCDYCDLAEEKVLFETKTSLVKIGSQHHHGHLSVILKRHAEDISELSEDEFTDFCNDMRMVSEAVRTVFLPDKLNFAMYGNWQSHLHWHIYPRYKSDPDWGQPPELGWRLENGQRVFKTDVQPENRPLVQCEIDMLKDFFKGRQRLLIGHSERFLVENTKV